MPASHQLKFGRGEAKLFSMSLSLEVIPIMLIPEGQFVHALVT